MSCCSVSVYDFESVLVLVENVAEDDKKRRMEKVFNEDLLIACINDEEHR